MYGTRGGASPPRGAGCDGAWPRRAAVSEAGGGQIETAGAYRWKGNSDRECGGDKGGRLSTDARAAWLENMARLASSVDERPRGHVESCRRGYRGSIASWLCGMVGRDGRGGSSGCADGCRQREKGLVELALLRQRGWITRHRCRKVASRSGALGGESLHWDGG